MTTSATSPTLRRMTAQSVLNALLRSERMTATDLMAATALSRPTVHAVCDQLIGAGWVQEHEVAITGTGRPARTYELNSSAGHVVGIDMGALKVRAVVADLRGEVLGDSVEHLRDFYVGGPERVDVARRCVQGAMDGAGADFGSLLGCAMGVPAPVTSGHVHTGPGYLPGLAGIDLRTALSPLLDLQVLVENDANLAAVGERWRGVAKGVQDVIVLLAGERLGAGLVLGGRLIRGAAGAAGELGFLHMVEGVGNTDAIGGMARELGAIAVAEALASDTPRTPRPGGLVEVSEGDPERVTAQHVVTAARNGDPTAAEVLDVVTERIARVITVLSTLLDPSLVVVGGGVAEAGDLLLPRLERHLRDLTDTPPTLATSALGDHAVSSGAIRLALDQALSGLLDRPATHTPRPGPAPSHNPPVVSRRSTTDDD